MSEPLKTKERFGARRIGCRFEVFERGSLMHVEWFENYEDAEVEAKKINEVLTKIENATLRSIVTNQKKTATKRQTNSPHNAKDN